MPEEEVALDLAEQSPLAFILSAPSRLSLVAFIQEGLLLRPSWPGKGCPCMAKKGKKPFKYMLRSVNFGT